jgi:hypothetical protein
VVDGEFTSERCGLNNQGKEARLEMGCKYRKVEMFKNVFR